MSMRDHARGFASLEEAAFSETTSPFWVRTGPSGLTSGNPQSYYAAIPPDDRLSFDVSNNRVLANIGVHGDVTNLTFYRGSHFADDMPGVWVHKDSSQSGPFGFRWAVEGADTSEDGAEWTVDLLDNIFPRSRRTDDGLEASVISFAPISADGTTRLPMLVHVLVLRSRVGTLRGTVRLPRLTGDDDLFTQPGVSGAVVGYKTDGEELPFTLGPGESTCVPYVFYVPGEYDQVEVLRSDGVLPWLNSTLGYFRSMLGRLRTPEPAHAALWERSLLGCFNAIGMDPSGNLAGSNWGSNPTTTQIWMKDLYYALLPFCVFEPRLAEKGILWFAEHGVRPRGARYSGGVRHSLSNSLATALLAGICYQYSRNDEFFREHPRCYGAIRSVLDDMLEHPVGETGLFPSRWISDALSLGIAHTGTNICAWKALSSMAEVAQGAFGDQATADRYRAAAERLHGDIERYMTWDGPFGRQLLEGIGALDGDERLSVPMSEYQRSGESLGLIFLEGIAEGGRIPLAMHDGEESDTTLMDFYGFVPRDSDLSRHTAAFAASSDNPTYSTAILGIRWDGMSGATFPGFTTAYWSADDEASHAGPEGRLTELVRLADLDGSWWWWPYAVGGRIGEVGRHFGSGKCAWAHGVFTLLYATQTLGLSVDPTGVVLVRPQGFCGPFTWEGLRLGRWTLSVASDVPARRVHVGNESDEPLTLISAGGAGGPVSPRRLAPGEDAEFALGT